MPKSKSSKRWLKEHFSDRYVKLAQKKGYRSRAVFKLLEIQQRDHLIKPGMVIVDLGAAPGGWSQIAKELVGEKGRIIALDILPMEAVPGVEFIQGDFTEPEVFDQLLAYIDKNLVDLVISDMAPNISGLSDIDQPRAMYLVELAWDLVKKILKPRGAFLVKIFQGEGFEAFLKELRTHFETVHVRKPQASRARSNEVYLLAKGFKRNPLK
jgi:23S rRNA (uridine2552-2'-O)-methyltransferase